MARWLLPENLSDVLPQQARAIEQARRRLLDLYRTHGYELVVPPLLEHIDSLLTGTGSDLSLQTFQIVDQLSGRTLGVRADTTPQVARIDSHILGREGVARLCYAGPTLHARPLHPLASREPLQVGAELYGESGTAADAEVLELAVLSARSLAGGPVQIDLGHSGVVRALLGETVEAPGADDILASLRAKDPSALARAIEGRPAAQGRALQSLLAMHGGVEVIGRARAGLPASAALAAALDELELLAGGCSADEVSVDLADLHGFRYHTGVTFAAWQSGLAAPLLRGGRYDDIGAAFGRARPATGFSILDLRESVPWARETPVRAILAPLPGDAALRELVAALRAQGEVVVRGTAGTGADADPGVALAMDREVVREGGAWVVRARAGRDNAGRDNAGRDTK
jgi:ATP phosphoribosyltransferase regulatory subunit